MFHDIFGHVPLLTNPTFSSFFTHFGKLGLKHINNDHIIEILGRAYWFTVEFGLIKEAEELKIYGAGILSSYGESKFSLSKEPTQLNFDIEEIMNTPYNNTQIQDKYFVIKSFDQLYESLPVIEKIIARELHTNS